MKGVVTPVMAPLSMKKKRREVEEDTGDRKQKPTTPRRLVFDADDKDDNITRAVTCSQRDSPSRSSTIRGSPAATSAARSSSSSQQKSAVTPTSAEKRKATTARKTQDVEDDDNDDDGSSVESSPPPSAKRRLLFGRYVDASANSVDCPSPVQRVYRLVHKLTGSIGGNGYSGPIYGELTMHSMQKVVSKMMEVSDFGPSSRFIDVGSGIGKPNLHVAQHPGVAFSCGVEMEYTRWTLGMTCLKAVVDEAATAAAATSASANSDDWVHPATTTLFLHENIMEADTLDPFTHVYMFSIGFPPELWLGLAEMWNNSSSAHCQYLICYHGPKDIIGEYEFDVELMTQLSTSMHGSKEGHMAYIYRRSNKSSSSTSKDKKTHGDLLAPTTTVMVDGLPCDPLFEKSFRLVKRGDLKSLQEEVGRQVEKIMGMGRSTRSRNKNTEFSKAY